MEINEKDLLSMQATIKQLQEAVVGLTYRNLAQDAAIRALLAASEHPQDVLALLRAFLDFSLQHVSEKNVPPGADAIALTEANRYFEALKREGRERG